MLMVVWMSTASSVQSRSHRVSSEKNSPDEGTVSAHRLSIIDWALFSCLHCVVSLVRSKKQHCEMREPGTRGWYPIPHSLARYRLVPLVPLVPETELFLASSRSAHEPCEISVSKVVFSNFSFFLRFSPWSLWTDIDYKFEPFHIIIFSESFERRGRAN